MDDIRTVSDQLILKDYLGGAAVRTGIRRHSYRTEPGLYALNKPDKDSFVFVSANYKLSFDSLRSSLKGISCFILVLDTKGINVWCAAGKGTFGTEELINRINETKLSGYVNHKLLILPQLGAPGVAAYTVRRLTGFRVVYGPVEARDIPDFLANNIKKSPDMRTKSFGILDRLVLSPVELVQSWRTALPIAAAGIVFILLAYGIGSVRLREILIYGFLSSAAGSLAGGLITPLFLPWLPGRAFALKGFFAGIVMLAVWCFSTEPPLPVLLFCGGLIPVASSFTGMNFTGSSTYTSLSGVRKEMRIAIPLQIVSAVLFCAGGILAAVLNGGAV